MSDNMRYPFLDLRDVTRPDRDAIVEAMTRVVDSGRYIGGEENVAFESELAAATGVNHAVGTANGLDALRLIFRAAIELGRLSVGDEVIVPANTYIASVLAVTDNALTPVFVEPDERTMNLDWSRVEEALTPRTRAVLTVHLYGRASWDDSVVGRLRQLEIMIVEDNAQAIGARLVDGRTTGSLGDAAAFSFYPTKNIGAIGDAGAVTTNDKALADAVRAIANYGSDRRYHNIYCGLNSRLDPLQAAILRIKLRGLEQECSRRRELARTYSTHINRPEVLLPDDALTAAVWHQYVIRVDRRDDFRRALAAEGVGTDIHYAVPPYRQPCYRCYSSLVLPVTDSLADTVVSLPVSPSTSVSDVEAISEIINRISY